VQCCSYFQVFLHHPLLPIKRGEEDAGVVAHWQPYPDLSSATTPAFSRSSPVQQETILHFARSRAQAAYYLFQPRGKIINRRRLPSWMKNHHTQQIDEYHPWGACIAYVIWLSSVTLFPALFWELSKQLVMWKCNFLIDKALVGASTCYVV
jgi:hypothetical protein